MKKLFSFRLSESTSDYLRGVVKGSGLTMTEYLEALVEIDRDRVPSWDRALVITEGYAEFVTAEQYAEMICDSVTGGSILGCVPDTVCPTSRMAFLVSSLQGLGLCEESDTLRFEIDTKRFVEALEHHLGLSVKTHILEW